MFLGEILLIGQGAISPSKIKNRVTRDAHICPKHFCRAYLVSSFRIFLNLVTDLRLKGVLHQDLEIAVGKNDPIVFPGFLGIPL